MPRAMAHGAINGIMASSFSAPYRRALRDGTVGVSVSGLEPPRVLLEIRTSSGLPWHLLGRGPFSGPAGTVFPVARHGSAGLPGAPPPQPPVPQGRPSSGTPRINAVPAGLALADLDSPSLPA